MNPFGKTSKLEFSAENKGNLTRLRDVCYTAPYKIMFPFSQKNGWLNVMVLNASAGIMAGDTQKISVCAGSGSKLCVSSQSYEKVHRMEDGFARRNTEISVEDSASCVYRPLPVIPFAGSEFESHTTIRLKDESSKLIYSEIISCGRAARGEKFQYRRYDSYLTVVSDGRLLYRDCTCLRPKEMKLSGPGFYGEYTHLATVLFFHTGMTKDKIQSIAQKLNSESEIEAGISEFNRGNAILKILGKRAQTLERLLSRLIKEESLCTWKVH